MKVLMVCSGGMSSSIIVKAIAEEAKKQNLSLNIEAVASGEVENKLNTGEFKLLLVAPQVKHQFARFNEYAKVANVAIEKIEPMGYTPLGATKTLDLIKTHIKQD